MIVAGDMCCVDPYIVDVVSRGMYFRELHGFYFMNLGRCMLECLEDMILDG